MSKPGSSAPEPDLEHVHDTVHTVVSLEQRARRTASWSEAIAEHITAFTGSMAFVWMHVGWFAIWMVINAGWVPAFDPPPFGLLTLIVSLEAIFLSTFVLISQNRQAARADRRSVVDLEVNLITERELTKLLELVSDIHRRLNGGDGHDAEVTAMLKETKVEPLAKGAMDVT